MLDFYKYPEPLPLPLSLPLDLGLHGSRGKGELHLSEGRPVLQRVTEALRKRNEREENYPISVIRHHLHPPVFSKWTLRTELVGKKREITEVETKKNLILRLTF